MPFRGDAQDDRAIQVFSGVNKDEIASANTQFLTISFCYKGKDYKVSCIIASQMIRSGEIVTVSYGEQYMKIHGINYSFFTKRGLPLAGITDRILCTKPINRILEAQEQLKAQLKGLHSHGTFARSPEISQAEDVSQLEKGVSSLSIDSSQAKKTEHENTHEGRDSEDDEQELSTCTIS